MIQSVVNEIEKDFGVVPSKNVIERKQFSPELPTYYNFIEKLYLHNIMPFPLYSLGLFQSNFQYQEDKSSLSESP